MLEDYLRTSGHKGHSFTCRGSPQACPKLFLRLFFNLLLRLVVVTVPLFFPIHSSRLTSTDFHLFPSPFRFMLFRCSLFSIDNVTSFGQVYRRTSPCIQAGNRLGFVKVECTEENRSSPYKKKGKNEGEKPWALLEGSLSSRRLCTCHPDSIPTFFSRKRTANKNPLWRDISQEMLHRATLTLNKIYAVRESMRLWMYFIHVHTVINLYIFS